ncbi:MAG: hypothetical protein ACRELX_17030 [Longimicrobiales bacterium]
MSSQLPDDRVPEDVRNARVLAGGIVLLCLGMVLAVAGVVLGGLFLPGVIVIGIALLAIALAAGLRLATTTAPRPDR